MDDILRTPVSWALIATLAGIYFMDPEKWVNCNDTSTQQNVIHSFIHTNIGHLMVNLYSLYSLKYLERSYGSFNYGLLVGLLLILSSFIQSALAKVPIWPFPTCSVGFSAVLLGLVIFDRLNANNWVIDAEQLQHMIILLIMPVIRNPRTSLTGHFSGILSGLILAVFSGFFGLTF